MNTNFLISNKWKKVGWYLFVPSAIIGILNFTFNEPISLIIPFYKMFASDLFGGSFCFHEVDFMPTLLTIITIISTYMICFSREKVEDEYISQIRLNALTWAFIINYIILILLSMITWDFAFLNVMTSNMFTPMIIFIIRFQYLLYKLNKSRTEN